MSMPAREFAAYRALWCGAVISILESYWVDFHRGARSDVQRDRVLVAARSYFQSADGREVLMLAGHEPGARGLDALIAAITAPARPRTGGGDTVKRIYRRRQFPS